MNSSLALPIRYTTMMLNDRESSASSCILPALVAACSSCRAAANSTSAGSARLFPLAALAQAMRAVAAADNLEYIVMQP